jgi:hypothetical protein
MKTTDCNVCLSEDYVCKWMQKLNKKFWKEVIAYFRWYSMGHIENDTPNNCSIVVCVFATTVTFSLSCCLAMIRGYTYRHTDWWEGFFNYAVEMGSGAVIYLPSCIKIGSGIQKLIGGDTQTARWSHKPTFIFFKIREVG